MFLKICERQLPG